MGWQRHRGESNASKFVSQSLRDRISALMDNRRRLLAQFPIDPMEIYRLFWNEQTWAARATLIKAHGEGIFVRLRDIPIFGRIDQINPTGTTRIMVRLPEEQPMSFGWKLQFINLPEDMQTQIKEWAVYWQQHINEKQELIKAVETVADVCKTYGHVYRLWPDLLGFFGEYGKAKIAQSKAKSRLPNAVYMYDRDKSAFIMKPEFKPEAFAKFSEMIAECLMLPETDLIDVGMVG